MKRRNFVAEIMFGCAGVNGTAAKIRGEKTEEHENNNKSIFNYK